MPEKDHTECSSDLFEPRTIWNPEKPRWYKAYNFSSPNPPTTQPPIQSHTVHHNRAPLLFVPCYVVHSLYSITIYSLYMLFVFIYFYTLSCSFFFVSVVAPRCTGMFFFLVVLVSLCCRLFAQETVLVPAVRQSAVLESVAEASHRRQARRTPGGVPLHHLRAGLLFAQLTHDAHLHVSQIATGRAGHQGHKVLLNVVASPASITSIVSSVCHLAVVVVAIVVVVHPLNDHHHHQHQLGRHQRRRRSAKDVT